MTQSSPYKICFVQRFNNIAFQLDSLRQPTGILQSSSRVLVLHSTGWPKRSDPRKSG
jgi:hypothetical protein